MVEPIMYFGIGFLVAALLTIGVIPLVHGRAVRLTTRRLEAATPLSMAEIQADKDQLRAEFAMSTRRLEMSVEQMKAKATSQLAELTKKGESISRLKMELGEKTATIFGLEAREKALRDQLRATEEEYSVKNRTLIDAEQDLANKEADLSRLTHELNERNVVADSQRVELVALRTQVEALKSQVDDRQQEAKAVSERLERERTEASAATRKLNEERTRVENLANRVGELEQQLVMQTTEAEVLGRRAQELEARLDQQSRALAEREYECEQLRAELATVRRNEADVRAELTDTDHRHRSQNEELRGVRQKLEEQLRLATAERNKLQGEIATMKREAETSWAAERVENALLRERINDIAADVARMTAALEGPNSPIEAILAGAITTSSPGISPTNGARNGGDINGDVEIGSGGGLADRIRALQSRVSQVNPSN